VLSLRSIPLFMFPTEWLAGNHGDSPARPCSEASRKTAEIFKGGKEMKRKILSVLLAVCLLTGCLPMAASAEDVIEYPLDEVILSFDKDTGTITGIACSEDVIGGRPGEDYPFDAPLLLNVTLNIPAEIDGVAVREIGECAFSGCYPLSYVTIPDSVTKIAAGAFDFCRFISFVSIPDSVTEIGEGAFCDCWSLQSALIPGSVKKISELAFSDCDQLASVTLRDGVTEICDQAFSWCYGLDSITIPASVTSIGENAFEGTKNFTIYGVTGSYAETYAREHDIPFAAESTSGSWGENAAWSFDKSTGTLTVSGAGEIKNEDSAGSLSKAPWHALCGEIKSLVIEDGITRIGNHAFFGCAGLVSASIPNSVTSIGKIAFYLCYGLTAVTIPDSVTEIDQFAFRKCYNLTICGKAGSYAETYAKENNISFAAVQPSTPTPAPTPVTPAEPDPVPAAPGFIDVPSGAYYADAVQWAAENGIAGGTDETHFSPDDPCTRGQAVAFLWRVAGKPEPQSATVPFTDIKAGAYYEKAVQWAAEQGITAGTSETEFGPGAACTRAQIVAFLYRAENSPAVTGENSFSDVAAGAYYESAVRWAAENEITSGTDGNHFSPDDTCVRGQVVTFLYRYRK